MLTNFRKTDRNLLENHLNISKRQATHLNKRKLRHIFAQLLLRICRITKIFTQRITLIIFKVFILQMIKVVIDNKICLFCYLSFSALSKSTISNEFLVHGHMALIEGSFQYTTLSIIKNVI